MTKIFSFFWKLSFFQFIILAVLVYATISACDEFVKFKLEPSFEKTYYNTKRVCYNGIDSIADLFGYKVSNAQKIQRAYTFNKQKWKPSNFNYKYKG